MSTEETTTIAEAVRNLIVCDTQFGWNGETTLKLPELLDLQARGWLIEGDENNEFTLTVEGQAVVAQALQLAPPPAQGIDLRQFRGWLCTTTDGVATDWTMEEDSRARFERMGRTIEPIFAAGPDVQGTRQDHLLDRRNRLMNSYGNGDREDAAVDGQIAQVDAELALIGQRDAAPGMGNG